ncbi:hypothetical protein BM221_001278 [Beauveria bassiana]|uniref:Uncharacterized protein n=1 Tax=Beauveria bassiana TaxID=176275 RepID=A0A2N6P2U7_BEABA|nr:hypothetical protein BM221_001278 [Beauveria bassiana]
MQILSVLLFTSLAMAAPAATSGGIKPGDAPCQPDKPINQAADVDDNRTEGTIGTDGQDDEDEEEIEPLDFEPQIPTHPITFPIPPVQHTAPAATSGGIKPGDAPCQPDKPINQAADVDDNRTEGTIGTYGQDDEDEE